MKRRFKEKLPRWLERALLPGAGLVLAFAALSLGATPAWARAAVELAVLALLGLWLLAGVLRGELSLNLPGLFFPLLAIFLFACLQAFADISVYPPATRGEVWELLAVGGFFLLLHNEFAATERVERFVTGLLLFASLLAVFAILQSLSFSGKFFWTWPAPQDSSPFGPFINRNHYAAWALMVFPLAWAKFSQRRRRRDLQAFWALVLLALGMSVLLSLSRAGLVLFLLAVPLYWWLGRSRRGSRWWTLAVGVGVIVLAAAATVALDAGRVVSRWQTLGEVFTRPEAVDIHRWQIWSDTLPMIRDHLWLGSGLETYGVLSDSYRSFMSDQRWLQAHNDYLQWLAETGLVGAGLAVWSLVALGRTSAAQLRLAAERPLRRLIVAALTGCLLVLLHSLVDFPLRIPANALLFAALLAIVTAPATAETRSERDARNLRAQP